MKVFTRIYCSQDESLEKKYVEVSKQLALFCERRPARNVLSCCGEIQQTDRPAWYQNALAEQDPKTLHVQINDGAIEIFIKNDIK